MGLNIGLYNISEVKENPDGTWIWPESDRRFDSLRYSGDREFCAWLQSEDNGEFKAIRYSEWDVDCFERPADLAKARAWVKTNIVEGNHKRWLDLFDLLEADTEKHLWLQEIW